MTKEQKMVREFRKAFGLEVASLPRLPRFRIITAALRMVDEEISELKHAAYRTDLAEIADGLCDALVTLYGLALVYGLDLEPLFKEVHRSNMTKGGGHIDKHGKYIKPTTYDPPNLQPLINKQRPREWRITLLEEIGRKK